MRTVFYNKFFSGISASLFISYLLKQLVFRNDFSFVYTTCFLGSLLLLLSWITYLKLDGVHYFQKESGISISKKLDYRSMYKKKGVYNMDNEQDVINTVEIPKKQALKATIAAYLSCSLILFAISQLYYQHIIR